MKKRKTHKYLSIVVYDPAWAKDPKYVSLSKGSAGGSGGAANGNLVYKNSNGDTIAITPLPAGSNEIQFPHIPYKKRPTLDIGDQVLYLGEVPNAPGHCAIAKSTGEVVWLYHPEDFRKPKDNEL